MASNSRSELLPLQDLESCSTEKKYPGISIASIDSENSRPVLGRRYTDNSRRAANLPQQLEIDKDEDTLNKLGNMLYKIHSSSIVVRYALYVLPVAALLAIPLVITAMNPNLSVSTASKTPGQPRDRIRLLGLFIWIEVIWVSLWICKLIAHAFPFVFHAVCGLVSGGVRKYSQVFVALEVPVSLFLWSIAAFATTKIICIFNTDKCDVNWLGTLSTVFKAGIIVAAIFLAEKAFIQIISINYHRKQYDEKIRDSKRLVRILDHLYDCSRSLFPEFSREFEEEDTDIQGNTLAEVRSTLARRGVHTKLFSNLGRVRDKATAAFGAMASDISGKQMFSTTSAHAIVIEALESERSSKALARRLWLSFTRRGQDVLYKQDLVDVLGEQHAGEAEEIFSHLDVDGNGDVSLHEMTMLVVNAGLERRNRATSMQDISQAIAVLDRLLSLIVLIAIALIYATFFSSAFAAKTTQLWTTFTGLAFAIGGTVTEFLSCCLFLFVKHPYDVGDRVDINQVELIVERISLMYTVFRRVDSDKIVQIPHNITNTLWVENVSRSKAMKERLTLAVAATTSFEDIETLHAELQTFVTSPEHRRDFQNEIDIELISVGDMKQLELRVEIRHKVSQIEPFTATTISLTGCSQISQTRVSAPVDVISSCVNCSPVRDVSLSNLREVPPCLSAILPIHIIPYLSLTMLGLRRGPSEKTRWMQSACSRNIALQWSSHSARQFRIQSQMCLLP